LFGGIRDVDSQNAAGFLDQNAPQRRSLAKPEQNDNF